MSRGILKSVFSYRGEIPYEILARIDYEDNYSKDCWSDIINSAIKGKLDYEREFNTRGYANAVRKNKILEANKNLEKLTYFKNTEDEIGGVSINSIEAIEKSYETLVNNSELEQVIDELRKAQEILLVEEGINLRVTLENAIGGIPYAVHVLKKLMVEDYFLPHSDYPLSELLRIALSNNKALVALQTM